VRGAILGLGLLVAVAACGRVNQRAFENVNRAGHRIEPAVTGRSTLADYRAAFADFSAALDAVKSQQLSTHDQAVVQQYDDVRRSLDDIRLVWEERETRRQELLPIAEALPGRLQKQYDLPVNTNEPPSIYATEARNLIWESARKKLDAIGLD